MRRSVTRKRGDSFAPLTSELLRRVVEVPSIRLDDAAVIHQAVNTDT